MATEGMARTNEGRGTCQHMCPAREVLQRQSTNEVNPFEATSGTAHCNPTQRILSPELAVKVFRRSAAGSEKTRLEDVRPLPVLFQTVQHLLGPAVLQSVAPLEESYPFIADRFLAVRQDAIVQGLDGEESVYGPMCRFYIFAHLRLSSLVLSRGCFDGTLNFRALQACLASLLQRHGRQPGYPEEYICYQSLLSLLTGGEEATRYALQLQVLNSAHARLTRCALHALRSLNYVEFFGCFQVPASSLLAATSASDGMTSRSLVFIRCLLCDFVQDFRLRSLAVMNKAYPKQEKFPLGEVCRLLNFSSDSDATQSLLSAGLVVSSPSASGNLELDYSLLPAFVQFHLVKEISETPHSLVDRETQGGWHDSADLVIGPLTCFQSSETSRDNAERLIVGAIL